MTGPAGMFYSKNVRVFGEHTLRVGTIATENYIDMTSEGNVSIKASNKIELKTGTGPAAEPYVIHSSLRTSIANINSVFEDLGEVLLNAAGLPGSIGPTLDAAADLAESLVVVIAENNLLIDQLGSTKIFGE